MTTRQLELIAARGRRLGMEMVFRAASGHIGGSLSAMDILTELYFEELRVDTAEPKAPGRDRFVMSKGHCTPALYSILALKGFFPEKQLELFRSIEPAHLIRQSVICVEQEETGITYSSHTAFRTAFVTLFPETDIVPSFHSCG